MTPQSGSRVAGSVCGALASALPVLSQSRRRLPLGAAGRVCACAVEAARAAGACAGGRGRPLRPRREPRRRSRARPTQPSRACAVRPATGGAMEPTAPRNELVSAEGRNRKAVLCQRCGSRVLQPGTALFSRRQVGAGRGRRGEPQLPGPRSCFLQVTGLHALLPPHRS